MFQIQHCNDVLVMRVFGELGLNNVRQFDSILNLVLREDVGKLVLDLSELSHIDYKLVPHILDRFIEIQCHGSELKLAGSNRYVADILKVMGFEEELYSSVEDAMISFAPMSREAWQ